MTRTWLAMLLCCLGTGSARAEAPVPQDFAYGFRVEAAGAGPIWELTLPEAVYRGVTRADLGDLRVFDAAGRVVPHALRLPGPGEVAAPPPVALPVFPLYRQRGEGGPVLRIVTNERGAVIDATAATTPTDAADRVEAYLIDASALERAPRDLRLELRDTPGAGFAATVSVETSDDLARWQPLAHGTTIAHLRAGDAALEHRDIRLPERKARYLRIPWPERLREVVLTKVTAGFAPLAAPVERQWLEAAGTPAAGGPPSYAYDSGGQRVVDRARLVFPSGNTLVRGSLQSATTPDGPWRTRHVGVHYRLRRDDARLESEPAQLPAVTDRYWRFVPEGGDAAGAGPPPALALGWTPHRLRFVAQGEPPYTVAFGSASVGSPASLLATLDDARIEGLTVAVTASEVFEVGGEARLRSAPWRSWTLWGVLLAALTLLAWMVRRLVRQLGAAGPSAGGR